MARRPRSAASIHAEWLRLIETSGPFLSLTVLKEAFKHGLDKLEGDVRRQLRDGYDAWLASKQDDAATHDRWIGAVLSGMLELEEKYVARFTRAEDAPKALRHRVEEHAETLWPQSVIHEAEGVEGEHARILVCVYPRSQRLDRAVAGARWAASPQSRTAELCRATGVRLGLVTNGEQWTLVDAPKDETVGYASWYAQLWLDEPDTFAAFVALLGRHRLFAVGKDETLEAILARSRQVQHEVTDQLGLQIRRAVEMLVRAFDRADRDLSGTLLEELDVKEVYEAAVTVMMRLVFLFSAEERGLLLLGDPLFDEHYAVSTLCDQLREVADSHGEEVLERRQDAWCRLLAAFRTVYAGVRHDRLQIRAYGGGLFDPDRYPFLEGRTKGQSWLEHAADPLPVDNRTVLHCLESLQYLKTRIGGQTEKRRLSFRALGIEQIGHVYEGLLDHTALRARSTTFGLVGKEGEEPEVELARLERLAARGGEELVKFLTGLKVKSSKKSVENLLSSEVDPARTERMRRACGSDELWSRVKRFASLIRDDDFEQPIVVLENQLYATAGADRSDTGTQYTPQVLTQEIVEHALEPLVYEGPAEGKPREEWNLRTPTEILDLKVCDMAVGSGAFLVQACRYLGERLMEAWGEAEARCAGPNPGKLPFSTIDYAGRPTKGDAGEIVPKDPDERELVARRLIAQRCLYGVDVNPIAAEMAKLSIWLLTLSKDKPFSFLDHAIRSGDSLLGLHDLRQLERFSLDPEREVQATFSGLPITELIEHASGTRLQIEQMHSDNIGHVRVQARLLADSDSRMQRLRFAADMLISAHLQPAANATEREDHITHAAVMAGQLALSGSPEELVEYAERALLGKRPFHWCLQFPEVLGRGGFDAIIGNPPFKGGQKLTGIFGDEYREYLVEHLARGRRGSADLVAYFFLRMASLLKAGGHFGLIATNTVAQGDTREVGLDQLVSDSYPDRVVLTRGVSSRPWPGGASLEVAHVYGRSIRGQSPAEAWRGPFYVDGVPESGVTSFLAPPGRVAGKPYRLKANEGKSFQGSIVLGMGFVMTPEEARALIARNPRNADVLMPYLNGEDLNSRPDQSPSRWVINFRDWPLKREALTLPGGMKASWLLADERQRKAWLRTGIVPQDYTDPVAADFPDCLRIVEEKVKPQRMAQDDEGGQRLWWRFLRPRRELYAALSDTDCALVRARIANIHSMVLVPSAWVLNEKTVVFPGCDFAVMQSDVHELWAREYAATLRTDMQYGPADSFETFPFPQEGAALATAREIGTAYYAHRASLLTELDVGLTSLYNRYHRRSDDSKPVAILRATREAMNRAVVAAYDWDDLLEKLRHGFYQTKQGERYTIHPDARAELLARLLELNHKRYAEEVEAGLHDKKAGRKAKRSNRKPRVASGDKEGLFQSKSK
jgi:hypothetical protein